MLTFDHYGARLTIRNLFTRASDSVQHAKGYVQEKILCLAMNAVQQSSNNNSTSHVLCGIHRRTVSLLLTKNHVVSTFTLSSNTELVLEG